MLQGQTDYVLRAGISLDSVIDESLDDVVAIEGETPNILYQVDGIGVGFLVHSAVLLSGGGLDGPGSGLIPLRFAYNEGLSLSNVSH